MDQLNMADELIADRYQVIKHLGEGAMGSVYLAQDTQLNRQVALKVLRGEWVSRPEVAKRLEMECQLMAQLGPDNNIVTLFDRVNHGKNVVMVIEYVAGENVADVLDRAREMNRESESSRRTTPVLAGVSTIALTPTDAIDITLQCLSGLDFAHSRGVIHRDIKPANIMVSHDHNGRILAKITDFGIGKAIASIEGDSGHGMTSLTNVGGPGPGTPAYMAPEQIDQSRFGAVGPASDLYALGVTLFEMLSLGLPFHGTYTELLHLHTNVEPPDLRKLIPGLSPALAAVVKKSLAKEQKDRYESAHRFRMELEAASREPIPDWTPGAAGDGNGRSAMPLVFGAIAVVALSVGGYFYVVGTDDGAKKSTTETESTPVVVPIAESPSMPEATPPTVAQEVPAAPSDAVTTEPVVVPAVAMPTPNPAPPVTPPDGGGAAFQVSKSSAESARAAAIGRFGGSAPSGSATFAAGEASYAKAAALEASGEYDAARGLLFEAKQSYESALPGPAPKAPVVQAQAPAPKAPEVKAPAAKPAAPTAPVKKPEEPATPAPPGGGFRKGGDSVVTHKE